MSGRLKPKNDMSKVHKIDIGSFDVVEIDKLFGPTIFANLRITADVKRGGWVIERMWIAKGEFVEWCVIPAQIEKEFDND